MRKKYFLALLLALLIVFGSSPIVSAESAQTVSSNAFGAKLTEYKYPSQLTKGSPFQPRGTITSVNNAKITKVALLIDGKILREVINDSSTFDMARFLGYAFSDLKEGTYKLEVAAYSGINKCIVAATPLKILPKFSAYISGYTPPSKVMLGNGYSLKGTITGNSEISKVAVMIDGHIKGEAGCSSKKFSMSSVDAQVKFGSIEAGLHTIKIVAYGKYGGSEVVAEHQFKVTNISFGSDANESTVSEKSLEIVRQIMKNASVKSCKITSTARTPYEQALAMYQNCQKTGVSAQKKIYGPNGDQVIDVYDKEMKKSNGLRGDALIEKMMNKINEIGPGKVSKHCGDYKKVNVFDIGYGSVSNKTAFRKALTEYEKKNKSTFYFIDEPDNSCFHIQITQ